MTRTMTLALSGMLAFAGLTPAQDYPSSSGPGNSQRLINSRYQQDAASRTQPSRNGRMTQQSLSTPAANPEFAPLAYIEQLYMDVLGRRPSDTEASYWLRRLSYQSRADIANELIQRRPRGWAGNYDPRYGGAYDPGYGSRYYPDPASLNFRDPGGPYFKSPYFPNYEYRRNLRAFPTSAQG